MGAINTTQRSDALQALRGGAALLVVLMHAVNLLIAYAPEASWAATSDTFRHFGHFGVDLFFVLSGLLIAQQVKKRASPGLFLIRRALRLFPVYWTSLVAIIALSWFTSGVGADWLRVLQAPMPLFLLARPSEHPVAWTLMLEVHFYIIAAIALAAGRFAPYALACWAVLQTFLVLAGVSHPFVRPLTLEFAFGLLLGLAPVIPKRGAVATIVVAAGLALLAAALMGPQLPPSGWTRVLLWGVPALAVVWATASLQVSAPRPITFLGDISYSMYLWHIPIMLAVGHVLSWQSVYYLPLAVALTITVGSASFFLIEKPVSHWSKNLRSRALVVARRNPTAVIEDDSSHRSCCRR